MLLRKSLRFCPAFSYSPTSPRMHVSEGFLDQFIHGGTSHTLTFSGHRRELHKDFSKSTALQRQELTYTRLRQLLSFRAEAYCLDERT